MAIQNQDNLLTQSVQVRDETIEGANTATRLGGLFVDVVDTMFTLSGSGVSPAYSSSVDSRITANQTNITYKLDTGSFDIVSASFDVRIDTKASQADFTSHTASYEAVSASISASLDIGSTQDQIFRSYTSSIDNANIIRDGRISANETDISSLEGNRVLTSSFHIFTSSYDAVSASISGSLSLKLEDAPSDGNTYGRNNGMWLIVSASAVSGSGSVWGGISGNINSQTDLLNSFVGTSSFDTTSASFSTRVTSNEGNIITLQNGRVTTSSFDTYTGSVDTFSASFSTRVTNNEGLSSSFDSRINLKANQVEFVAHTASFEVASASFSTRVTSNETLSSSWDSRINLKTDLAEFRAHTASYEAVSSSISGSLSLKLEDAPSDGNTYGRNNGAWVITSGSGGGSDVSASWGNISGSIVNQTDLHDELQSLKSVSTNVTSSTVLDFSASSVIRMVETGSNAIQISNVTNLSEGNVGIYILSGSTGLTFSSSVAASSQVGTLTEANDQYIIKIFNGGVGANNYFISDYLASSGLPAYVQTDLSQSQVQGLGTAFTIVSASGATKFVNTIDMNIIYYGSATTYTSSNDLIVQWNDGTEITTIPNLLASTNTYNIHNVKMFQSEIKHNQSIQLKTAANDTSGKGTITVLSRTEAIDIPQTNLPIAYNTTIGVNLFEFGSDQTPSGWNGVDYDQQTPGVMHSQLIRLEDGANTNVSMSVVNAWNGFENNSDTTSATENFPAGIYDRGSTLLSSGDQTGSVKFEALPGNTEISVYMAFAAGASTLNSGSYVISGSTQVTGDFASLDPIEYNEILNTTPSGELEIICQVPSSGNVRVALNGVKIAYDA